MNVYVVLAPMEHAGIPYQPGDKVALPDDAARFQRAHLKVAPAVTQATPLEIKDAQHRAMRKNKTCCF